MTGTDLVKEIEKYYQRKPNLFWFIRTNVARVKQRIKSLPKGFSDGLLLIKPGIAAFVETKSEGEKQRLDQIAFQTRVEALGFHYLEVKSIPELQQKVEALCK